jgi:hypothetical protein
MKNGTAPESPNPQARWFGSLTCVAILPAALPAYRIRPTLPI